MNVIWIVLILSIAFCDLLGAVEVCRHGARSPIVFVPQWDGFEVWPQGRGELVPAGMRQHFLLGSYLRKKYIDDLKLLSKSYKEEEIFVFSSDYNRTIMSVQSQIQGLYPAGTGKRINKEAPKANWNPPIKVKDAQKISENFGDAALPHQSEIVPIHTDDNKRQFALRASHACPYYKALVEHKQKMSDELGIIYSQYSDVISVIQQQMNYSESQAQKQAANIIDSLICYNFSYETLPLGFNSTFLARASLLFNKINSFVINEPDLLARFAGTALLSVIVNDLKVIAEHKTEEKLFIYSAHDSTLNNALAFLELDFSVNPPFASTMIFELHLESGELFVDVKYNGKTTKIVGCNEERCSLKNFQKYVEKRSIPDYFKKCEEKPDQAVLKSLALKAESEEVVMGGVETSTAVVVLACIGIFFALLVRKPARQGLITESQVSYLQLKIN